MTSAGGIIACILFAALVASGYYFLRQLALKPFDDALSDRADGDWPAVPTLDVPSDFHGNGDRL
jgi:hypothetical protein